MLPSLATWINKFIQMVIQNHRNMFYEEAVKATKSNWESFIMWILHAKDGRTFDRIVLQKNEIDSFP